MITFWISFIIIIGIGALGSIDTFHYFLFGLIMLSITYLKEEFTNS